MTRTGTTGLFKSLIACGAIFLGLNASASDHVKVAIEIGITPEALVVADITTTEAQIVLTQIAQASSEMQNLVTAHAAVDSRIAEVSALKQRLSDDPNNQDIRSQLELAILALNTARQSLEDAQSNLFTIALANCDNSEIAQLTVFQSGNSFKAPADFRAVERTSEQWTMVERALRAESRANRRGEDLDEDYDQLLINIRSDPRVTYAAARLLANLEAMKTLFNTQ